MDDCDVDMNCWYIHVYNSTPLSFIVDEFAAYNSNVYLTTSIYNSTISEGTIVNELAASDNQVDNIMSITC